MMRYYTPMSPNCQGRPTSSHGSDHGTPTLPPGQSSTALVSCERLDAGIVQITLNAPTSANALSSRLVEELASAIRAANAVETPVLAIRSSDRIFCSGFDLKEPLGSDDNAIARFIAIQALLELLGEFPGVTVALVGGDAIGAGADLVARCDYRVMSVDARVAFPGAVFGLVLGLPRLVAITSSDVARDLALTGRILHAVEAKAVGYATDLAEPETWREYLDALADRVRRLDSETVRAIVRATRGRGQCDDASLLMRSIGRPGLAERISGYRVQRLGVERSTKQSTSYDGQPATCPTESRR